MSGQIVDNAMRHASEVLDAAGDAEYAHIRTDVLDLLVRWINVMRPVRTDHVDDFNRWQDVIDAAIANRTPDDEV